MWVWALSLKEFRQLLGIGAITVLIVCFCLMQLSGYEQPFMTPGANFYLLLLAGGGALVVGFWQTMSEHQQGTWLFLLHRPVSWKQILLMKIAVGLLLISFAIGGPVLLYVRWLSRPGNLVAPFYWEMTVPFWNSMFTILSLYLAGFLAGLRKARWLGSRLLPVLFALELTFIVLIFPTTWKVWLAIGIVNALLIGAILQQCQQEEYA